MWYWGSSHLWRRGRGTESGFAFFTAVHVVTCALTKFNPVCKSSGSSFNRSSVHANSKVGHQVGINGQTRNNCIFCMWNVNSISNTITISKAYNWLKFLGMQWHVCPSSKVGCRSASSWTEWCTSSLRGILVMIYHRGWAAQWFTLHKAGFVTVFTRGMPTARTATLSVTTYP